MHGRDSGPDGTSAGAGFHLSDVEESARTHAILCTIVFLILLPIGALVGRLTRTWNNKWFYGHAGIQLLISGPVILVGWSLGFRTTSKLHTKHFIDPHEKIGLALLVMYLVQVFLGAFIHYFKFSSVFRGHRPPQNYFHVLLGLFTLILAQYQVHYGLFTEWAFSTGGLHIVPESAKHAWLALIVIFWVLYVVGMAFLPRQFKEERAFRKTLGTESDPIHLENKGAS